jgi:hypothetical protein
MTAGFTPFVTTARAPTIALSPTITPGPMNASAQIQTPDPIRMLGRLRGSVTLEMS